MTFPDSKLIKQCVHNKLENYVVSPPMIHVISLVFNELYVGNFRKIVLNIFQFISKFVQSRKKINNL